MRVEIKSLTGKITRVEVRWSDTVHILKCRYAEKELTHVDHIRHMIFLGKRLEDDLPLSAYNFSNGCTVYAITRFIPPREDVIPPIIPEMEIFKELKKICKREEHEGNSRNRVIESENLLTTILEISNFGPLLHILSFFDPLTLLYLSRTCKSFYSTSFYLLECGIVKLNQNHIDIIFGNTTNDSLFRKLCSYDEVFNEKTRIRGDFLVDYCVKQSNLETLRYLIEEKKFSKGFIDQSALISSLSRDHQEKKEMVIYLIQSICEMRLHGITYFSTFSNLFELLEEDHDILWNCIHCLFSHGGIECTKKTFFISLCRHISKNPSFVSLEDWTKIEPFLIDFKS